MLHIGTVPKAPKRRGQRATSSAAYALQRRAIACALAALPKPTPGWASDVSATSMPCASINSSASSGVQSGYLPMAGPRPASYTASR